MVESTPVFEKASQPPPSATAALSLQDWETSRDSHTPPFEVSAYRPIEANRDEFRLGMKVLGWDTIHPQQQVICDVLNSVAEDGLALYDYVAVQVPRRSGKSESLTALAIGRCLSRPKYYVAVTFLSTGTKVQTRWKTDVFQALARWADTTYGPEADGAWPFKLVLSNGHESVQFTNGSRILILPPKASSFRSESFDLILLDEAGEASADESERILADALPTMDTRPGAQLVVSGTPSNFRKGNLLWESLEAGRNEEDPRSGIVNYAVGRELTLEDVERWELVEPLLLATHPGIGSLTTLDKVKRNYSMGALKFATEYLGWFKPDEHSTGVLNPGKWEDAALTEELPRISTLPARVTFGVASRDGISAVCAAWRTQDGVARLLLLRQGQGHEWLPGFLEQLVKAHPLRPIAHDERGDQMIAVEELSRKRPAPKFSKYNLVTVPIAAGLLQRELHTGMLQHYGQHELTESALSASKREIGRTWAYGKLTPEASIVAIEAASMALREYDVAPAPQKTPAFMSPAK